MNKINVGITISENVLRRLDAEVESMQHRTGGFSSRSSYISETLVERWGREDAEKEASLNPELAAF